MIIKKPTALYEFHSNGDFDYQNFMYALKEVEAYVNAKYSSIKEVKEESFGKSVIDTIVKDAVNNGLEKYVYILRDLKQEEYKLLQVFEVLEHTGYEKCEFKIKNIESFAVETPKDNGSFYVNVTEEEISKLWGKNATATFSSEPEQKEITAAITPNGNYVREYKGTTQEASKAVIQPSDDANVDIKEIPEGFETPWSDGVFKDNGDEVYTAVAMKPNEKVLRVDNEGSTYYAEFSADVIEKLYKKYAKDFKGKFPGYISDGTDGYPEGSWIVMSSDPSVEGKGISVEFNTEEK